MVVVVTATTGMRGLALVILLQMEIGAAGVISAGSGADQFQCAIYIGSVLRTVSTVLAGTVLLSLFWTCPWIVPVQYLCLYPISLDARQTCSAI